LQQHVDRIANLRAYLPERLTIDELGANRFKHFVRDVFV